MKRIFLVYIMILITGFSFSFETLAEAEKNSNTGIICDNQYVLCTSAPCIPDPSNPDSKAICSCDVNNGKNFGMSECDARTPVTDSNGVTKAVSNYSFNQAPIKPALLCPAGKPWTSCLDKPCIIDPMNPLKAICTCDIEREESFVTFGGQCNTLTCDNAYWSAATADEITGANTVLMKAFGVKDNPVQYCPGINP